MDAAREAFTAAVQLAAKISAAVAIGAAILAVLLHQRVRLGSELDEDPRLEPERALAHGRPC